MIKMLMTKFGLAVVLQERAWFNDTGYKLRLTENSICPGKVIEYISTRYTKPIEEE